MTPNCIQNEDFDQTEYDGRRGLDEDKEQSKDLHGLPEERIPEEIEGLDEFLQRVQHEGIDEEESEEEEEPDDSLLPERPEGCEGRCEPVDEPGPNDVVCPHCTAKAMRDEMRQHERYNRKRNRRFMSDILNRAQESRFDEVVRRIGVFLECNFGDRARDFHVGAKQRSKFDGEDVAQTMQITSDDGTVYFVTVGVMKSPNT